MTSTSAPSPFDAVIETDGVFPFFLTIPGSDSTFGTRRPVRVVGDIDGHRFAATLMPSGTGPHWLPLRAALRRAVGKQAGDRVSVRLTASAA